MRHDPASREAALAERQAEVIVRWIDQMLADARRPVPMLDMLYVRLVNDGIQELRDEGHWDAHAALLSQKSAELVDTLEAIWPGWPQSCRDHAVSPWGIHEPALVLPVAAC